MLMKSFKNYILILIFFYSINSFGQSPYATPAQIIIINTTRSASEGDLYLDTVNNDFYIGLTNGKLAKIGDIFDETIDTVYVSGDSIVIIEAGDTMYGNLTSFASGGGGGKMLKEVTTDIDLIGWVSPYTEEPITQLNVSVPNGMWFEAEYHLIVISNEEKGFGLKNVGYTTGDFISGIFDMSNYDVQKKASGGDWYKIIINNTYYDNEAGTARELDDIQIKKKNEEFLVRISIRYKNLSGGTVVFGYAFGYGKEENKPSWDISVLEGSTMTYQLY